PHTPRANFIATAAGPAVNLLICVATGLAFVSLTDLRPPFNPFWYPLRDPQFKDEVARGAIRMYQWNGTMVAVSHVGLIVLARLFWVNWILFLFNMVLVGFPMDAGRLLQCVLWPRYGFRQS